jgi:hypothetical protein
MRRMNILFCLSRRVGSQWETRCVLVCLFTIPAGPTHRLPAGEEEEGDHNKPPSLKHVMNPEGV